MEVRRPQEKRKEKLEDIGNKKTQNVRRYLAKTDVRMEMSGEKKVTGKQK